MSKVQIRPIHLPHDVARLRALDNAFTTDRIYVIQHEAFSVSLVEQRLSFPLSKNFGDVTAELADLDGCLIAEAGHEFLGIVGLRLEHWNRRAVIQHLYVQADCRGQGVGRQLLAAAQDWAVKTPCRCLWVETPNINYPAVQFYLANGFDFVGTDLSLYDPEGVAGNEVPIFFSRPIQRV